MAKYSTGGTAGVSEGDACELCGEESSTLTEANVAGAELLVCSNCAPHDDASHDDSGADSVKDADQDRKKRVVQNAARTSPVWQGDSERWEKEGAGYDDDQLPYLVADYGEVVVEARTSEGLQPSDLAAEIGVDEMTVLAIEQERAYKANVGGSVIEVLEDRLDIQLIDE